MISPYLQMLLSGGSEPQAAPAGLVGEPEYGPLPMPDPTSQEASLPSPGQPPVSTTDALRQANRPGNAYADRAESLLARLEGLRPKDLTGTEKIARMLSRGGSSMMANASIPGASFGGSLGAGMAGAGRSAVNIEEEKRERRRQQYDDMLDRLQGFEDKSLDLEVARGEETRENTESDRRAQRDADIEFDQAAREYEMKGDQRFTDLVTDILKNMTSNTGNSYGNPDFDVPFAEKMVRAKREAARLLLQEEDGAGAKIDSARDATSRILGRMQ